MCVLFTTDEMSHCFRIIIDKSQLFTQNRPICRLHHKQAIYSPRTQALNHTHTDHNLSTLNSTQNKTTKKMRSTNLPD